MSNRLSNNIEPQKFRRFELSQVEEDIQETDEEVKNKIKNRLQEVSLEITAQLGKTNLSVSDLLKLSETPENVNLEELEPEEKKKHLIKLDQYFSEPITLLINDRPVATGEVIPPRENSRKYRIRIISILS